VLPDFAGFHIIINHDKVNLLRVACKRQSSVNNGAWLRRFDDVTGVEKSCVAKGVNRKKRRKKYLIIVNKYTFPQTSNTWMFAMFKNFMIHNC